MTETTDSTQTLLDMFAEVRERIPAVEIAKMCGCEVNRSGFCKCPFHAGGQERTPSLKFSPDGLKWHCYGCNEGGSSVDFVMLFFGLDAMGAARKLNRDFLLNIPGLEDEPRPTRREQQAGQKRKETTVYCKGLQRWRDEFRTQLDAVHRKAHLALKEPHELTDAEHVALTHAGAAMYFSETLRDGTPAEVLALFRQRERIQEWITKALRD